MNEDKAVRKNMENDVLAPEIRGPRSANKTIIKALIVGDEEGNRKIGPQSRGESKARPQEDYWASYEGRYVDPPIDPEFLATVEEYSTILSQCIEAMEINIEGFGYMLRPLVSLDQLADDDPKRVDVSDERREIDNFLKRATGDDSLTAFRRKQRHDLEGTGNAFMELVRRPLTGLPDKLVHIPSYQIRLGKLDSDFTEYTQCRQVEIAPGQYIVEKTRDSKRFRRYLQLQYGLVSGPGIVWFKEYGDPRPVDCRNGNVVDEKDLPAFPKRYLATEMIHRRIYSSRTPYGMPRYKGCLITLLGDREGEEVNYITLKNNNIPSMIIAVSNGQITQETVDRLRQFTKEQIQGSKNYSRFLVLEAEGMFEGTEPGNIKLDVKPLASYQNKDQMFTEYGSGNREKVRQTYRLPPIFIGVSSDYTRATAEASRRLADEQVFRPERDEVDYMFNIILYEFGMKYHTFKSNGPNITDDEDLLKLLIAAEKAGGMDPRTARQIVADILGQPAVETWPATLDPDTPFSLQMAEAVKNKALVNEPGQQVTALKTIDGGGDALLALMELRDRLIAEIYGRETE